VRRLAPIPDCPAVLDPNDPDSGGSKERAAALAHYSANGEKSFEFKVYGDRTVRAALNAAFGGKCAYCESRIDATQPTAIEHYRPKGGVETSTQKIKPGYYWLASTWENLLPSCTRCNSAEKLDHYDGVTRKSGKGNWFPLKDEALRANTPGAEVHEEPLLLHPYHDEPERHLEFMEEGVVRARKNNRAEISEKGEATISILGLNRRGLAEARLDKRLVVDAHLAKIKEYERDMLRYRSDTTFEKRRDREIAQLARLLKEDQEYTAVVAQRVGIV
jgi:uncharacterized protein (TIGR02646 family)